MSFVPNKICNLSKNSTILAVGGGRGASALTTWPSWQAKTLAFDTQKLIRAVPYFTILKYCYDSLKLTFNRSSPLNLSYRLFNEQRVKLSVVLASKLFRFLRWTNCRRAVLTRLGKWVIMHMSLVQIPEEAIDLSNDEFFVCSTYMYKYFIWIIVIIYTNNVFTLWFINTAFLIQLSNV